MLAYTYVERGKFELQEKQKPALQDDRDAIIRVTLASICTSDLPLSMARCRALCRALPLGTKWWAWWRLWGRQ